MADSHFMKAPDFTFHDGRTLPGLRLHYQTLGGPRRNSCGEIDNAVLLLHGTGGKSDDFLLPSFTEPLFGAGKPLDAQKYFIIMPDAVGHGRSSKPSDGLRMNFPGYNFDDMVALQHKIVAEELGIAKLRLVLGTSMGGMHSWLWGVTYPGEIQALMAMACSPFPVAGLNWIWRKGIIDAIKADPAWQNGNYQTQPPAGMRAVALLSAIATTGAPNLTKNCPTQSSVEGMLSQRTEATERQADANDVIYQFSASKGYDASARIENIKVPVLWWGSADDFINPPTLPYPDLITGKMSNIHYKLLPASADTTGHMTFLQARYFATDILDILNRSTKN